MPSFNPPATLFQGRRWASEELAGIAAGWRDFALGDLGGPSGAIAVVMTNHPLAVALFFALSSLPVPLIVLPPDQRAWRTSPPLPTGTLVFLLPWFTGLAPAAERLGLRPAVVPEPRIGAGLGSAGLAILTGPGLVMFTSGTTGPPKPVYRSMPKLLAAASARLEALAVPPGGGIACALPLFRGHALNDALLGATVAGCHVGLLERFDHRALLALFASGEYHYWSGSAVMADALVRSAPPRVCRAPAACSSLKVPERVFRAFQERFGVPLRGGYSSTETGPVTLDAAVAANVRPETLGRPMAGADVRIGDDPWEPLPAGRSGRIWARTPWPMEGYGYPPALEPVLERDGWRPTRDLGRLDEAGYLHFLGRLDDCVKTGAGHLVNLAEVAAVLASYPAVVEAEVLSAEGPAGPVLAALLETTDNPTGEAIRAHVAQHLPPWSYPRVIRFVRELPRLPGGKVDRTACRALLG